MDQGSSPQPSQQSWEQYNVFYVGVARRQDQAIVADLVVVPNCTVETEDVKKVLRSDQLSERPDVHFYFNSGPNAWHLMSDPEGRIFIAITNRLYPQIMAYELLKDLKQQIIAKTGTKALQVRQKGLQRATDNLLKKIIKKYDNPQEMDIMHVTKIQSVNLVLTEDTQNALANCVTCKDASLNKEQRSSSHSIHVSICSLSLASIVF